MIGRWFFVAVKAVMIGQRGCIRGRTSCPRIVVVMGRIIMQVVVVLEHGHELLIVEFIEVVVLGATVASDEWSFEESDGITYGTTVVSTATS